MRARTATYLETKDYPRVLAAAHGALWLNRGYQLSLGAWAVAVVTFVWLLNDIYPVRRTTNCADNPLPTLHSDA